MEKVAQRLSLPDRHLRDWLDGLLTSEELLAIVPVNGGETDRKPPLPREILRGGRV